MFGSPPALSTIRSQRYLSVVHLGGQFALSQRGSLLQVGGHRADSEFACACSQSLQNFNNATEKCSTSGENSVAQTAYTIDIEKNLANAGGLAATSLINIAFGASSAYLWFCLLWGGNGLLQVTFSLTHTFPLPSHQA